MEIGLQNKGPNISFENKRYKNIYLLGTKITKWVRPLTQAISLGVDSSSPPS